MPLFDYRTVPKPFEWDSLLVEIGFGRGDFIVRLAKENPHKRIVGFELSGISIEKLHKRLKREGITNVYFTRIDAYWGFYLLFRDGSVEKVYINYPDPWFKKRHHKRRLTNRENLYIFAKKLKKEGSILIRTDHYPFVEHTLQEAQELGCFSVEVGELTVEEPLTKYEAKWLSQGKKLYKIELRKVAEPQANFKIKGIKEVQEVFPIKVEGDINLEKVVGKEYKLSEGVYLKTFDLYEGQRGYLIEALLSEEGFVQKFFFEIRKKERGWVVDVSKFSEVLRTEGLQRAVNLVTEELVKP